MQKDTSINYPIRYLAVVLIINCIVLVSLSWFAYDMYRHIAMTARTSLRIAELRGDIIHLDEVLTMSARMAVVTGDPRWEQRYRRFETKLDAAIKEAEELAPGVSGGAAAAKTDAANVALVAMENNAFGLLRKGRLNEAKNVLFGVEYKSQKDIYAAGIVEFAAILSDTVVADLERLRPRIILAGILIISVFPLILSGWLVVVRTARRWQVRLTERGVELETALRKEKKLNELQQQFVSMASHEFRTPLAIIDGAAQRMMRLRDRLAPDDIQQRTGKIRDAVTRMTMLIDSTLSAARLDAGAIAMSLGSMNLAEAIAAVCKRQQEISPSRKISVDIGEITTPIVADAGMLDQVFTNLLSNAAKYSPDNSLIEVTGWIEGEEILVAVRDYGLGIPEEDLPRMCERFFRAGTSAGIAGTGIGLHLVKQFVEMHGGAIAVESVEGEGSTFTIRLPFKPAADAIAPVTAGPAPLIAA